MQHKRPKLCSCEWFTTGANAAREAAVGCRVHTYNGPVVVVYMGRGRRRRAEVHRPFGFRTDPMRLLRALSRIGYSPDLPVARLEDFPPEQPA